MDNQEFVTVVMITYAHEHYIREAIEGVLKQQANFQFRLIIADDCSPDNTNSVVQDIIATHPKGNCIDYIRHEINKGMMPNFIFALQRAKGKYIALCEGDDYWTDIYKLQKQVDFLEVNPDYVIHSGVAQLITNDIIQDEFIGLTTGSKYYTIENFYKQNNLVTCTVLFRNVLDVFPVDFKTVNFGDWYLYVMLLQVSNSKAFRSTEVFSVYRVLNSGVMKSLSQKKNYKSHLDQIVKIKKLVGYQCFPNDVITAINWYCSKIFVIELFEKNFISAIRIFFTNVELVKHKISIKLYLTLLKKC